MIDAREARRVAKLFVRNAEPAFIAAAEAAIEAAAAQGKTQARVSLTVQGYTAEAMYGVLADHVEPLGYRVTMVGGPPEFEALVTW